MTRLLAAALLLTVAAAPAFACEWNKSVSVEKPSTVASQPQGDQTSPPPAPSADQKPG
jgi:hypothetical protein